MLRNGILFEYWANTRTQEPKRGTVALGVGLAPASVTRPHLRLRGIGINGFGCQEDEQGIEGFSRGKSVRKRQPPPTRRPVDRLENNRELGRENDE
jgi:hypothetical protein